MARTIVSRGCCIANGFERVWAHSILVSVRLAQAELIAVWVRRGARSDDLRVVTRVQDLRTLAVGVLRLQVAAVAVGRLRGRVRPARCHKRGGHILRDAPGEEDAYGREQRHVGREAERRQRWRRRVGRRPQTREVCKQVLVQSATCAIERCTRRVLRLLKAGDARVHEGERIACVKKVAGF